MDQMTPRSDLGRSDLGMLLRANATFSAVSGVALLAGWSFLDTALGVDGWLLIVSGLALAGYGAALFFGGNAAPRRWGIFAIAMDFGWVVAASGLLAGFPAAMTPVGRIGLAAVSVIVGGFGVLQARAIERGPAAARG